MIATIANGTCWPNIGWAAFRFAGGTWQLIPGRHDGFVEALAAVGPDIRETVPIWRKKRRSLQPNRWNENAHLALERHALRCGLLEANHEGDAQAEEARGISLAERKHPMQHVRLGRR